MKKRVTTPCYAVIFTSWLRDPAPGYPDTAERMVELAQAMPGFLGMSSVRDGQGFGITVSYWDSLEAIAAWKAHPEHLEAQRRGKAEWYKSYELRICRVERAISLPANDEHDQ